MIISDEKMPGMSGTELLAIARKKYPETIRQALQQKELLKENQRLLNIVRKQSLSIRP